MSLFFLFVLSFLCSLMTSSRIMSLKTIFKPRTLKFTFLATYCPTNFTYIFNCLLSTATWISNGQLKLNMNKTAGSLSKTYCTYTFLIHGNSILPMSAQRACTHLDSCLSSYGIAKYQEMLFQNLCRNGPFPFCHSSIFIQQQSTTIYSLDYGNGCLTILPTSILSL